MSKAIWIKKLLANISCPADQVVEATLILSEYWEMAKVLEIANKINKKQGDFEATSIGATLGGFATHLLGATNPLPVIGGTLAGGYLGHKTASKYFASTISDTDVANSTSIKDLAQELQEEIVSTPILTVLNRRLASLREKVGTKHKADIMNGIGTAIGAASGYFSIRHDYGEHKALIQESQTAVGAVVGYGVARSISSTLFSTSQREVPVAQTPRADQTIRRRR